jgi:hypothetical protein
MLRSSRARLIWDLEPHFFRWRREGSSDPVATTFCVCKMKPSSSSYRRRLCVGRIVVAGPAILHLLQRHNGSGLCCAAAAWSLSSPQVAPVRRRRRRRRTMPAVFVPVFLSAARNDDNDDDDGDGSVGDDEDGRNGRRNTKFTGRSRLFGNERLDKEATAKEDAAARRNRVPYEREMNLASRFEQTLPVQALLLALAIAFVAYVGLSGGITDGSERYFFDDDAPSSWTTLPYPNDDVATTTTDSVFI